MKRKGGGQVKFYPYEKAGGGGGGSSHPERGHTKFWGSFNMGDLSVNHIGGGGGRKKFAPFKREGHGQFYLFEGGGGRNKFLTHDFPIL